MMGQAPASWPETLLVDGAVVTRCRLWVNRDQVIEIGLQGHVRFDPDSDHDRTALQYVAKRPEGDIRSACAGQGHLRSELRASLDTPKCSG
jgi:hypothetical protein